MRFIGSNLPRGCDSAPVRHCPFVILRTRMAPEVVVQGSAVPERSRVSEVPEVTT